MKSPKKHYYHYDDHHEVLLVKNIMTIIVFIATVTIASLITVVTRYPQSQAYLDKLSSVSEVVSQLNGA